MLLQAEKRSFLVWMAMGAIVLVYAVWSGKAAGATCIFFLSFPTLCRGSREVIPYPWLRWVLWPVATLGFCVTMADLWMSRSDDPWFSSTLHRTIIGIIGSYMLALGYMMRRTGGKSTAVSNLPASPRFWPS